jgi:hypothetical protein
MFNAQFWKQTAERAVKGFAVAFMGAAMVGSTGPLNAFHLNWGEAAGIGAFGALSSVLLSFASLPLGEPNSPSAVRLEPPAADALNERKAPEPGEVGDPPARFTHRPSTH